MGSMVGYSKAAMERAMKVQEVILRAMAKRITWWQAAEIVGISDRWMRRWRERYQEFGYDGLFDKRRGKASPREARSGSDLLVAVRAYGQSSSDPGNTGLASHARRAAAEESPQQEQPSDSLPKGF